MWKTENSLERTKSQVLINTTLNFKMEHERQYFELNMRQRSIIKTSTCTITNSLKIIKGNICMHKIFERVGS